MKEPDALVRIAEDTVRAAQTAGADHAEVYVREGENVTLTQKGPYSMPKESHTLGVGIRLAVDGRMGISGSSGLHRIDAVIREALQAARGAGRDPTFSGFAEPEPIALGPSPVHEALQTRDAARIQETARLAMAGLEGPDSTFAAVSVSSGHTRWAVANDSGVAAWDQGGAEHLMLENRLGRGDHSITAWDGASARGPVADTLDIEVFARHVTDRATRAFDAQPLESPVDQVILDTAPAAQVLSKFFAGLSGSLVASGQSPLGERLGDTVAPATLTIHDMPHGDDTRQRLRVDHEGVPTKPLAILRRGVLGSFLYDTAAGRKTGNGSNGHAMRGGGWASGVGISTINPVVAPGDKTLDQMIADADRAVYVTDALTGMFTSNVTTGDFSAVVPYAFLVEGGEVKHALPNTTVAGNVHKLMADIRSVGRDPIERRTGIYTALHAGGVSCAT